MLSVTSMLWKRLAAVTLLVLLGILVLALNTTPAATFFSGEKQAGASAAVVPLAPCWAVVNSPDIGTGDNALNAISAISDTDIWAAGYYMDAGIKRPLILHWNGTQWSPSTTPAIAGDAELSGVFALGPDDVWVVGQRTQEYDLVTLAMHWGPSHQWAITSTPNVGTGTNRLRAVSGSGPNDVWAVGEYRTNSNTVANTLTLRWTAGAWAVVNSPNVGTQGSTLHGVQVGADGRAWAVGSYRGGQYNNERTLALRWDAGAWSVVATPNWDESPDVLYSVSTGPSGAAWAVGSYNSGLKTLTLRWSAGAWELVASPNPGSQYGPHVLYGVAAISASDAWAVGFFMPDGSNNKALLLHWDGTQWNGAEGPSPAGANTVLQGVVAPAPGEVWAVGIATTYNPYGTHTYVARYGEPCIPTPTYTLTPTTTPTRTLTPTPTAAPPCGDAWREVVVPAITDVTLTSITARAADDVWAVGYTEYDPGFRTVAMHWDGFGWTQVPSPSPGLEYNAFSSVALAPGGVVWAVGLYSDGNLMLPLAARWDGSQWQQSPLPSVGWGRLLSVNVAPDGDVWAVGFYTPQTTSPARTLVMRYYNSQWSRIDSPNVDTDANMLTGVSIGADGTAWAVGYYGLSMIRTLIMRWDGSAWTVVSSPNPSNVENKLSGVTVVSSTEAWAVGEYQGNELLTEPMILRWNGSVWTAEESLDAPDASRLMSVTMLPSGEGWAVGDYFQPGVWRLTFVMHYTPATGWQTVWGAPNHPAYDNHLYGVGAYAHDEVWAVGSYDGGMKPLALKYGDANEFRDVLPGSTFYDYVRCLVCNGIISGYDDGTFRPNNSVTRGQLSKIVANAAGFSDPQTVVLFEDVSIYSTFYQYIGRLATRGFISGYPCGGAGEPCVGPANLPYFRPSNNASRGQISKIVSNAAGFADPPSGQQYFEDVPVGSTYYTFTLRLVTRLVMSGYPCGGAGEPCVPPGNLPYFRPNNNATRGQTSKIVANAFFPGCEWVVRRR